MIGGFCGVVDTADFVAVADVIYATEAAFNAFIQSVLRAHAQREHHQVARYHGFATGVHIFQFNAVR